MYIYVIALNLSINWDTPCGNNACMLQVSWLANATHLYYLLVPSFCIRLVLSWVSPSNKEEWCPGSTELEG